MPLTLFEVLTESEQTLVKELLAGRLTMKKTMVGTEMLAGEPLRTGYFTAPVCSLALLIQWTPVDE